MGIVDDILKYSSYKNGLKRMNKEVRNLRKVVSNKSMKIVKCKTNKHCKECGNKCSTNPMIDRRYYDKEKDVCMGCYTKGDVK